MEKYTYALLLAGTIIVPFARSFEPRIYFRGRWKELFAAIFTMSILFIAWDIYFTAIGIWSFNHNYVTGWFVAGLPWEEWLFFIIVPYACMFIYEVLRYFFPGIKFPRLAQAIALILAVLMLALAVVNSDKTYTVVVFALTATLLLLATIWPVSRNWLSHFFLTYLVTLIPFGMVNGVLTGMPVVEYNDAQNLGIRIMQIPVEDFAYLMSMMIMVTMIYEKLRAKAA